MGKEYTEAQLLENRRVWEAYARWFYRAMEADREFEAFINAADREWDGDDLGDAVSGMTTLRTFLPHPMSFDPPITKEEVL